MLLTVTSEQTGKDGYMMDNRKMTDLNFPKGIHYETQEIIDEDGNFLGFVDYGERMMEE